MLKVGAYQSVKKESVKMQFGKILSNFKKLQLLTHITVLNLIQLVDTNKLDYFI